MKRLSRIICLILCVAILAGMSVPVSAAQTAVWSNSELIGKLSAPTEKPAAPGNLAQADFWCWNLHSNTWWPTWEAEESRDDILEDIRDMAETLTSGIESETGKARAIFDWVSTNIA